MALSILPLILSALVLWSAGCEEDNSTETKPVELTPAKPIPEVDLTWYRIRE